MWAAACAQARDAAPSSGATSARDAGIRASRAPGRCGPRWQARTLACPAATTGARHSLFATWGRAPGRRSPHVPTLRKSQSTGSSFLRNVRTPFGAAPGGPRGDGRYGRIDGELASTDCTDAGGRVDRYAHRGALTRLPALPRCLRGTGVVLSFLWGIACRRSDSTPSVVSSAGTFTERPADGPAAKCNIGWERCERVWPAASTDGRPPSPGPSRTRRRRGPEFRRWRGVRHRTFRRQHRPRGGPLRFAAPCPNRTARRLLFPAGPGERNRSLPTHPIRGGRGFRQPARPEFRPTPGGSELVPPGTTRATTLAPPASCGGGS